MSDETPEDNAPKSFLAAVTQSAQAEPSEEFPEAEKSRAAASAAEDRKAARATLAAAYDEAEEVEFEDFKPMLPPSWWRHEQLDTDLSFLDQNDICNAQRMISRYGKDLMFVDGGGWYAWTGTHWSIEDGAFTAQKFAQRTAKDIKREAYAMLQYGIDRGMPKKQFRPRAEGRLKFSVASGNSGKITAMMKESQPHLAVKPDALDHHTFKVTLLNGTLDLQAIDDGQAERFDPVRLSAHDRGHRMTRCGGITYDPNAACPHFKKFMDDIFPDKEVLNFMQRWLGHCLTGDMREQVLVMFYGGGSNGKSTLMNLLDHIFNGYAARLPFASLLRNDNKKGSEASPDLARLPGTRLVMAAEPDTGVQFSESMLKELTGGEKMTVRMLHKDFFEFKPQFKLMLSFNNKPSIRGQDDGIWRRILLIPFEQRFVDADKAQPGDKIKDRTLEAKLMAEDSGIFNWMLDGYRMWAEKGLQIPATIRAATDEYRHENNLAYEFITAWCETGEGYSVEAGRLYKAFDLWCKLNAIEPWGQTKFGRKLSDMQYGSDKRGGGYKFRTGLQLNQEALDELAHVNQSKMKHHGGGDD